MLGKKKPFEVEGEITSTDTFQCSKDNDGIIIIK